MHVSVMLNRVVECLAVAPGGVWVDATLGGGGHARAILEASGPDGTLVGIDRDADALRRSTDALASFAARCHLVHANYDAVADILAGLGIAGVQGIVADLGVSLDQLATGGRGFSFTEDGPLDMRMNPAEGKPLSHFLATMSAQDLADALFYLGGERHSRRVAQTMKEDFRSGRIASTRDLAHSVLSALPAAARTGRIHGATRTFQGLRKLVNDESGSLERFIPRAFESLAPGGRLVVISFESGEDRLVKLAFKSLVAQGQAVLVHKKPLVPEADERRVNRRARSAKLRTVERVAS